MTYTIFKDGDIVKGLNENKGIVEFIDTDISKVLNAINSVIIDNGTIDIREGIYNPGSQVKFTKSINLITEGNVTLDWNKTGLYLFEFNGSELFNTTITTDILKGSNTITVTNISGAMPGDLILIYDNTIWNPGNYPTWKTGELHEILNISGNTIIISDSTINSFSTSLNGSVRIIRPISVVLDGININGVNNSLDYRGIYLNYNKNSIIRNGKFENNGVTEIANRNSYNTTIENNIIGNNIYPGTGYGVSVSDGSAYTTISKNYFYNSRHCVTTGGYGVVGQPRDVVVIGNTFVDSTGTDACLDAHMITESYYIYNNTIYSPISNWAVSSGAKVTKAVGNTVYGGFGFGANKTLIPDTYYEVKNNTLFNSRYIFKDNYVNWQKIIIDGNSITSTFANNIINIGQNAGVPPEFAIVTNNVVKGGGPFLINATTKLISQNYVNGLIV